MANKRRGQLTVSGEWAQHLRPLLRRAFWKGERQAKRVQLADEIANAQVQSEHKPVETHEVDYVADIGHGRTE